MTAREIATHVKVSRNFISRRAKTEGWEFRRKRCRGGHTHNYNVQKLPADIREKIPGTVSFYTDNGKPELSKYIMGTLAWVDRLTESPWGDRACWAVIGMAAAYFGPVFIRILAR